jgi:hypothetical protein
LSISQEINSYLCITLLIFSPYSKILEEDTNTELRAYFKYEGKQVEDGFLDARKSAQVLLGMDEALRFFLYQENSSLQKMEFEIPIRIHKGSWEALLPENFNELLIKGALTWGAAKYIGKAVEQMAINDFKDVGFKQIFKKSFKAMVWTIKMARHLGTITKKSFKNLEFSEDNSLTKIKNEKGEELWVPTEYLEVFANCPETLFNKLAKIVEEERELVIGYNDNGKEEVRITYKQKSIFVKPEVEEEILFPELKDGDYVELGGHITRGNENSNTIGFLHSDHILTCFPDEGKIIDYKNALFTNCTIKGFVQRTDKDGNFIEKRPKIRFLSVEIIDKEKQKKLFE